MSTMIRQLALLVLKQLRPTNPMANTISRVRANSWSVEGCADASSKVWMCREMGTGSSLLAKDLSEHNGTMTVTVSTESIASNKSDG